MTLRQLGGASSQYALGAQKSPDQSWYPIGLTVPPAFAIPGTVNCPYLTIVLEVSKTNESFEQLLDDAALKHFSINTSVQIWIGTKLFPGHGSQFKAMFRLRDQVNGGVLAGSGAQTDFLPLNQPTKGFLGVKSLVASHQYHRSRTKCLAPAPSPRRRNRCSRPPAGNFARRSVLLLVKERVSYFWVWSGVFWFGFAMSGVFLSYMINLHRR